MKDLKILNGGSSIDDRGIVTFINDFHFENVKRFYQVENHSKGYIRAWHGHKKEGKYVYVIQGTALIGVVDMTTEKISTYILSDKQIKILYIPPGYYNGFKSLEENTKIIFFSTSTIEESIDDDYRENFNRWDIWNDNYR